MPDITIQINTPALLAGSHFKVRYRMLPAGAWSSYTTQTNAAFTLTGLAAGGYELEVVLVRNGVECPATIRTFTVTAPFTCLMFDAEIVAAGSQHNLEIGYTLPGGYVQPPCGWQVQAIGNTTNKVINYTTLPAPPIKIPVANEGLLVRVIANLCNGKTQTCYEGDVTGIPAPCLPLTITSVVLSYVGPQPNLMERFKITFHFTQSTPATTLPVINIQQINGVPGNLTTAYFNPYGPISPTATSLSVFVDAAYLPPQFNGHYYFEWFFMDACYNRYYNDKTEPLHIQL